MEVFLISYLIQIPLALYAAFGLPRPPGLGEKTQRLRNLVIGLGLAPCGPLSVFLQTVYLLMYFAAVKAKQVQTGRQQKAFEQATGNTKEAGGGNPFGTSTSPPRSSADANPFGNSPAQPPATSPEPNPFGSGLGAPSEGQDSDNPFA